MGHVNATFDQRAYRFRNDDGDEADATWKAAQGTPVNQNIGEVFRLRIAVQETAGGGANNQTIVLQSNVNNEGWFTVDSTSQRVRLGNSPHVSDGTATTKQMTGTSGTFLPGLLLTETSGTNISFAGNDHTEVEWASLLITGEVAHGQTVQFRVTINGSLPDGTTSGVPSVTAQAVAPTESPTLSAGTPTSDTIPLSWTAVAGAETYELQRDLTTIQNTSALTRDDSGLDVETEYSYRVRAVNDVGEGPWSNTVTPTTAAPPQIRDISEFTEDFESGTIDTDVWEIWGSVTSIENGQAKIMATTGYSGIATKERFNLSGQSLLVHTPRHHAGEGETFVSLYSGGGNALTLLVTKGSYQPFDEYRWQTNVRSSGSNSPSSFERDPSHEWIRIREDDGTIYFEASSNSQSWSLIDSRSTPTWLAQTPLYIELLCGVWDSGDEDPDNYALFDNINVPLRDISEFTEDFESGLDAWQVLTGGSHISVDGGRLRINSSWDYASIEVIERFNFIESSLVVQIPKALTAPNNYSDTNISVKQAAGSWLIEAGAINTLGSPGWFAAISGSGDEVIPRNPSDTWMRISEANGTVTIEVGDGHSWTELHSGATPDGMGFCSLELYAGVADQADEDPNNYALFDNINVPPPPSPRTERLEILRSGQWLRASVQVLDGGTWSAKGVEREEHDA